MKAGKYQTNLVQAFVSCGNVGGNSPNTTAGGSTPSCAPPEGFYIQNGHTADGWRFDPLTGQGLLQLKAAKAPFKTVPFDNANCTGAGAPATCCTGPGAGTCASCTSEPCNPPGDTVDVAIQMKLKGVFNGSGPAGPITPEPGTLATVSRATFNDRSGGGTDMTVVDFPAQFNFSVSKGAAKLKTSADTLLNGAGLNGLPHCTSLENVNVIVVDPFGDTFADPGVFMP